MAKEYNISKTEAQCRQCEAQIDPGEELTARVREQDGEFVREDFCLACWEAGRVAEGQDVYATWRVRVPMPDEKKKKLLVDDAVLINFFQRLEGENEPVKVGFRYVLALVLMRKKLLVYDRREVLDSGAEIWKMHFRKTGDEHEVVDPKLDEDKIAEVSQSLGDIIEADL